MSEYSFTIDPLKLDIKKRAVRGSGVTLFSNMVSFVLQIIGTMILARLLTPEDYGLVTIVTTFSLLLQNVGGNGFTEAIIQKETLDHSVINTLFWINGGLSLSLTLLFALSAPVLALFYHDPKLKLVTVVISLSIISSGLATIHAALLNRKMEFVKLSVIGVVSKLVGLVVSIVLALLGFKYWALVVNMIALPLTTAAGSWILCKWRPSRLSRGTNVAPMVKFAVNTYGKFSLNYFSRNIDNFIVGKVLGSQSLGFYKKAYDLFALSANSLIAPLSNVALSSLSKFSSDQAVFRRYYLNALSMISFISMAVSLLLTIAARDIVLLILGPQWGASAAIFMYFGPGISLMLIYYTHGWLHLALGRPDRLLRWAVVELVVTAILLVAGLRFGAKGVALGWTVSFVVLTFPGLWYAGLPIRLKATEILSAMGRYLAAAVCAGGLSGFILFSPGAPSDIIAGWPILLRLAVSFLISSVLYVFFVVIFYGSLAPLKMFFSLVKTIVPWEKFRKRRPGGPE